MVTGDRRVAQCGTESGYSKHRRNGEVACQACKIANTQARRDRSRRLSVPAQPKPTKKPREASFDYRPAHWWFLAACRQADPDWFFAVEPELLSRALLTCHSCAVTDACRDYAVNSHSDGVWGGLLPHELKRLQAR